jgi:hypothetical protein
MVMTATAQQRCELQQPHQLSFATQPVASQPFQYAQLVRLD